MFIPCVIVIHEVANGLLIFYSVIKYCIVDCVGNLCAAFRCCNIYIIKTTNTTSSVFGDGLATALSRPFVVIQTVNRKTNITYVKLSLLHIFPYQANFLMLLKRFC